MATMSRLRSTPLLVLLLASGLLQSCATKPSFPERSELLAQSYGRNVLVILLDAAAAGHFGSYGYDRPTTPRIDQLAAESVLFEQAYAQASGTAMSMYSTFSSHYPVLEKVPDLQGENAVFLSDSLVTLPEALSRELPHRLIISTNPFVSARMGFGQGVTTMIEDWKPGPQARAGQPPRYADRVTRPGLNWIRERDEEPWFAFLHYLEPHAPYMPPQPFRSQLQRHEAPLQTGDLPFLRNMRDGVPPIEMRETIIDLYDGNLAYVDAEVGALVDSLKADGQWEDTIMVLLSDHGEGFWQHRTKGHGGAPYEEVVRIPLLLRIPGVPELEGQRIATPVELVDLMPTLLDLAGIDRHQFEMAGRSWVPLLTGTERDEEFPVGRAIHLRSNRTRRPVFALRRGPWKWMLNVFKGRQELYNLSLDPGEQDNLLRDDDTLPAEIADFPDLLARWLEDGVTQNTGSTSVDNTTLDAEMIESLRSLGYIE